MRKWCWPSSDLRNIAIDSDNETTAQSQKGQPSSVGLFLLRSLQCKLNVGYSWFYSFNRQVALGPKDRQLVAPSREGGVYATVSYLSAEGASRFMPALRASGLWSDVFPALTGRGY
jgi:hypothetical protein